MAAKSLTDPLEVNMTELGLPYSSGNNEGSTEHDIAMKEEQLAMSPKALRRERVLFEERVKNLGDLLGKKSTFPKAGTWYYFTGEVMLLDQQRLYRKVLMSLRRQEGLNIEKPIVERITKEIRSLHIRNSLTARIAASFIDGDLHTISQDEVSDLVHYEIAARIVASAVLIDKNVTLFGTKGLSQVAILKAFGPLMLRENNTLVVFFNVRKGNPIVHDGVLTFGYGDRVVIEIQLFGPGIPSLIDDDYSKCLEWATVTLTDYLSSGMKRIKSKPKITCALERLVMSVNPGAELPRVWLDSGYFILWREILIQAFGRGVPLKTKPMEDFINEFFIIDELRQEFHVQMVGSGNTPIEKEDFDESNADWVLEVIPKTILDDVRYSDEFFDECRSLMRNHHSIRTSGQNLFARVITKGIPGGKTEAGKESPLENFEDRLKLNGICKILEAYLAEIYHECSGVVGEGAPEKYATAITSSFTEDVFDSEHRSNNVENEIDSLTKGVMDHILKLQPDLAGKNPFRRMTKEEHEAGKPESTRQPEVPSGTRHPPKRSKKKKAKTGSMDSDV